MNGFINFYKPSGMSSALALSKIKKLIGKRKCGHMGTLDPLASGVLPVAIGKATRLFDFTLDKQKVYMATFTFGFETDSLDLDGSVIKQGGKIPTFKEVELASKNQIGIIEQYPPKFSAKKVNGKRGYELARQGVEFELKPKKIEILDIKVLNSEKENSFDFLIKCKGGTYIRSICRDIALSLNTYATMTKLERLESGIFNKENSVTLEQLESLNLESLIIEPQSVLTFEEINLTDIEFSYLINGRPLKTDKNGLYSGFYNGEFIGVLEAVEQNLKIKAYIKD